MSACLGLERGCVLASRFIKIKKQHHKTIPQNDTPTIHERAQKASSLDSAPWVSLLRCRQACVKSDQQTSGRSQQCCACWSSPPCCCPSSLHRARRTSSVCRGCSQIMNDHEKGFLCFVVCVFAVLFVMIRDARCWWQIPCSRARCFSPYQQLKCSRR